MENNKLAKKGIRVLKELTEKDVTARSELKQKTNGRFSQYGVISAEKSFSQHVRQWQQVAEYLTQKYEIKKLKAISVDMIIDFIISEYKKGLGEKTLKARITAINHVLVGSGVWEVNQAISLKQIRDKGLLSRQKAPTNVYKALTSEEWRKDNPRLYEAHRDIIDFARAFGLRREGIFGSPEGQKGRYKGVTFQNLGYIEGQDTLFVETIEKGGKYHVAVVRDDFKKEMWVKYGHLARKYAREYFEKSEEERKKLLERNSRAKERIFTKQDKRIPLHINRNEYVQHKLQDRQKYWSKKFAQREKQGKGGKQVGYSRIGFKYNPQTNRTEIYKTVYKKGQKGAIIEPVNPWDVVKIGTWRGYAIAACDVMRYVGHNRLDVTIKYM